MAVGWLELAEVGENEKTERWPRNPYVGRIKEAMMQNSTGIPLLKKAFFKLWRDSVVVEF